jgi:hypothetical protein
LPTHLPHEIEKKKKPTGTQEIKYKYLEIYVFFSFLAPGDKRKGGCQDYKGFCLKTMAQSHNLSRKERV